MASKISKKEIYKNDINAISQLVIRAIPETKDLRIIINQFMITPKEVSLNAKCAIKFQQKNQI